MPENKISCPSCQFEFEPTDALTKQIKSHLEVEFSIKSKESATKIQEMQKILEIQTQKLILEKQQNDEIILAKNKEFEAKTKAEMNQKWLEMETSLKQKVEVESRSKIEVELKDLQAQRAEDKKKIADAVANELELRRQTRELLEMQKNAELEMARKLDFERKTIFEKAKIELDETMRLKLAEKDKQMEQLKNSLQDAQRKAQQGSMQIQGDVQENELKQILSQNFPHDQVLDVATGIKGADLIHDIFSVTGQNLGKIIWESKRTKTWSEDWIKKLKDDQATAQADVAVLATQVMPESLKTYGYYKGVWVVHYDLAHILALTGTIRHYLGEIYGVKNSVVGRDEKMAYLYNYLSGSQFKNKMENIVSAFTGMKEDLETEKRAMMRIWAKRDKEITRVIESTSGLYGDLQGIIGASLQTIPSLELPSLGDIQSGDELFQK